MASEAITINRPAVSPEQVDLVRRTVAKDATPDELELYFYDCARRGVHPLDKLIHFTKRKGKYTPITSIDFMRIRASDSGEYGGNDDPVFEHAAPADKFPTSAFVSVYRIVQGQRCAFTATARWSEYAPDLNDSGAFMWKKMPHLMLGKVAEALALRKAFPQQLAGLYASEEMDQANKQPESKKQVLTGLLTECKAFENCSVAKVGPKKIVVTDGGFDSLLVQLGEREEKSELEIEVEHKTGPKGKYLELLRILKINGKPYLEGALIESIKKVEAEKAGKSDPEGITDADEAAFLNGEVVPVTGCISPVLDFKK